jgi:hypothetical protein
MDLAFIGDMYDCHRAFPPVSPWVAILSLQLVVLVKDQVTNRISVAAQALFVIGDLSRPLVDLHTDGFLSDCVQLGKSDFP